METGTLEEVLRLARRLSPQDKLRLIERIAREMARESLPLRPSPRRSLWGLCADLGSAPSAEEIDRARQEEWANFPRGDI